MGKIMALFFIMLVLGTCCLASDVEVKKNINKPIVFTQLEILEYNTGLDVANEEYYEMIGVQ